MNVTVSQLNAFVKELISSEPALFDISVTGEVSGLKMHSSGHIYFTLKDESAAIRCAFFKPHTFGLRFKLKDGMKVVAKGRVSLYERDGQYQLTVTEMEEDGIGALYARFELLKKKLYEEGLFDESHKKPIPQFARKIGVVTSPTGAVIRDIINVSLRRNSNMQIVLAPVKVQGEDAPPSICAGIKALDQREDVDVIIVGRGGGSMEDLWCFNDESVARAVFEAEKPIISAVGHETDFTIIDFVADLRAPTPSAAAELAVFDFYDAVYTVERASDSLDRCITARINEYDRALLKYARLFKDPQNVIESFKERLLRLESSLLKGVPLEKKQKELEFFMGKLDALSPLKVLERGYSVVTDSNGKVVKTAQSVNMGDTVNIRLASGELVAEVKDGKRYDS